MAVRVLPAQPYFLRICPGCYVPTKENGKNKIHIVFTKLNYSICIKKSSVYQKKQEGFVNNHIKLIG